MQIEKTLHIKLNSDDVGKYAIVPGDPTRCELIAKYLDNSRKIQQNREHTTYEGFLEGEKVVVTSTGMGGPSTAIAIEELYKCGVDTFIRIGTGASTSVKVSRGDIIVVNGAIRMEGTGLHYLPMEFPSVPDYHITKKLEETALELGYPTEVGLTITKDSFFTQTEPETKPIGYELKNRWDSYIKGGAICTAMEEATLFLVAASLNARAASVLVSATDYFNEVSSDISSSVYPTSYIDRAIKVGVESLRKVIIEDKNKK